MSAGDLITKAYHYEFRELLMGSGTPFIVEKVEGLFDLPALEHNDFVRNDSHGSFLGRSIMRPREIDMEFYITGTRRDGVEARRRQVIRTFIPTDEDHKFVFSRPGESVKFVWARVDRRSIPSTYELASGVGEGAVVLLAADPRIYSLDLKSRQFTVADGASSGQAIVINEGDYYTPPVIRLQGQMTNPVITNSVDARVISWVDSSGPGDTYEVNTKTRRITKNGVDISNTITEDGDYFKLQPDSNTIVVNRTGTVGTVTVTVEHRDAWV